MAKLTFKKVLDISDLPDDWSVVRVASDWFGRPLVLIAEGKPEKPRPPLETSTWVSWLHTQPRAHHLVHMQNGSRQHLRLENAAGASTFHIQPLEDGWLVGERRGSVGLYDGAGICRRSFDLGDASEDVQTTPQGEIWVSYFDEGVFGGTIAKEGVVCFDLDGAPRFRYGDFAEQNKLPFVADCYAMNVVSSGDVWLNYYMEFPLVHIVNGVLDKVVLEFGCVGNDFALRDDHVLFANKGNIFMQSISSSASPESVEACDESGRRLIPIVDPHTGFVGRGSAALLNTGTAIYELA